MTEDKMISQETDLNKMKPIGKLAAGVSHDFNNIFSIISGYSRMASKRMEEGDYQKAQTYMDRIDQAIQRGTGLTRKLLLFGEHKITGNENVDLQSFIEGQKDLLYSLLAPQASLFLNCYESAVVECPPDLFTEALIHLIENSQDAFEESGAIIIETRLCHPEMLPAALAETERSYIMLTISDTGTGIDKDILEHVTDPFFTTKDQGKGTGLGLSIVSGVVKQMNGLLTIETQKDHGTSVHMYLPVSQNETTDNLKKQTMSEGFETFEGFTILIVDDEKDLLEILRAELQQLGFNVLMASNGNNALSVQDDYDGKIDLLLTDIIMPEIDGVKLSGLFQSVRPETRIVFMSGFPANGTLSNIQFPEDVNILAKPLQLNALPHVLRAVLKKENIDYGKMNIGDAVWSPDQVLEEG